MPAGTIGQVKAQTPTAPNAERPRFDECALAFLASEFAGRVYQNWSIERRLEGYLRHQGMSRVADAGETFDRLLDEVMVNFAKARRKGLLGR